MHHAARQRNYDDMSRPDSSSRAPGNVHTGFNQDEEEACDAVQVTCVDLFRLTSHMGLTYVTVFLSVQFYHVGVNITLNLTFATRTTIDRPGIVLNTTADGQLLFGFVVLFLYS